MQFCFIWFTVRGEITANKNNGYKWWRVKWVAIPVLENTRLEKKKGGKVKFSRKLVEFFPPVVMEKGNSTFQKKRSNGLVFVTGCLVLWFFIAKQTPSVTIFHPCIFMSKNPSPLNGSQPKGVEMVRKGKWWGKMVMEKLFPSFFFQSRFCPDCDAGFLSSRPVDLCGSLFAIFEVYGT